MDNKLFILNSWLWALTGALLGFFVFHPFVMINAHVMFPQQWPQSLRSIFAPDMLPWGLGYATLGGLLAWFVSKYRSSLVQKKKLQGALELAGATCHELNQPMQVILGYADIVRAQMKPDDPFHPHLNEIVTQIVRMDSILKRIRNITTYESFEYLKGVQIIDIDKASGS